MNWEDSVNVYKAEYTTKSADAIRGDSRAVYWDDETFSRLLFFHYKGKGIWLGDWVCFINSMQICAVAGCGISESMIYIHISDKLYQLIFANILLLVTKEYVSLHQRKQR